MGRFYARRLSKGFRRSIDGNRSATKLADNMPSRIVTN
jgi:hypothetical protein